MSSGNRLGIGHDCLVCWWSTCTERSCEVALDRVAYQIKSLVLLLRLCNMS